MSSDIGEDRQPVRVGQVGCCLDNVFRSRFSRYQKLERTLARWRNERQCREPCSRLKCFSQIETAPGNADALQTRQRIRAGQNPSNRPPIAFRRVPRARQRQSARNVRGRHRSALIGRVSGIRFGVRRKDFVARRCQIDVGETDVGKTPQRIGARRRGCDNQIIEIEARRIKRRRVDVFPVIARCGHDHDAGSARRKYRVR